MTNRAGPEWETRLEGHLRPLFGNCERLTKTGRDDQGDLWLRWNGRPYVIEAKAEKRIDLAGYVKEAAVEAGNWHKKRPLEPKPIPLAIVKRRNHNVSKAYVVRELDQFVRMVKQ